MFEMMLMGGSQKSPYTSFLLMEGSNAPPGRVNSTVTVMGKDIYVLGGTIVNIFQDRFDRWSETTNTWESLAAFPETINSATMVAIAGKIYVFGGLTAANTVYSNLLYSYTPGSNTWVKLPSPVDGTVGKVWPTTFAYGTDIYIVGGINASGLPLATMRSFNIATNTWRDRAAFPTTIARAIGTWVNGKYYIVQGVLSSGTPNNSLRCYDPINNQWTTIINDNNMGGASRYGCAIAEFDRVIYLIGSRAPWIESFDTVRATFNSDSGPYPTMANSFNARSAKIGNNNYLMDLSATNILIYKWG